MTQSKYRPVKHPVFYFTVIEQIPVSTAEDTTGITLTRKIKQHNCWMIRLHEEIKKQSIS